MNRQERRKRDRERAKEVKEIEKDFEVLKKLNSKELASINRILDKSISISKKELMESLDRNLTAALIEDGFTIKQIRELQDRVYVLSKEDKIKKEKLEREKVDMAKLQAEVREFMKGLIKSDKGRKEVVEETMFKFPKLSKTAVNNAFGKIQEELEIEDAASYILEDNKELKEKIKEEAKEIAKSVADNLEKELEKEDHIAEVGKMVEESKEEVKGEKAMSKLKIKKVELEGEFGSYIREGNKVVAGEIIFNSLEELEEYQRKEIELFNRRMEEIKEVYKIG